MTIEMIEEIATEPKKTPLSAQEAAALIRANMGKHTDKRRSVADVVDEVRSLREERDD